MSLFVKMHAIGRYIMLITLRIFIKLGFLMLKEEHVYHFVSDAFCWI